MHGWGPSVVREATEHGDRAVKAAGLRALARWRDADAVSILRGTSLEADPKLSGALHEARDEHDPTSIPAAHERAPLQRQRWRQWQTRRARVARRPT